MARTAADIGYSRLVAFPVGVHSGQKNMPERELDDNGGTIMQIKPGVNIGATGRKVLVVAERYPQANELYVTSGLRDEPGSHHNGLSWNGSPTAALDFGAYDDPEPNAKDQADMRDFAKWLLDNFSSDLAELIHTTPYEDDNGFYIQNGVWHNFDSGTMAQHLNHVHVALSAASADRILAKLGAGPVTPDHA